MKLSRDVVPVNQAMAVYGHERSAFTKR